MLLAGAIASFASLAIVGASFLHVNNAGSLRYATLAPTSSVGLERLWDSDESAIARAEHAASVFSEKVRLANEAARSERLHVIKEYIDRGDGTSLTAGGLVILDHAPLLSEDRQRQNEEARSRDRDGQRESGQSRSQLDSSTATSSTSSGRGTTSPAPSPAPVGPDGRVRDTPEVEAAKAAHAAAQANERINLANEEARSRAADEHTGVVLLTTERRKDAPIGRDGRVIDTPEVALARALHASVQARERARVADPVPTADSSCPCAVTY